MELGFLQETKAILKSLVISSPNGMTLERLNRDYRDVVGNWIPFRKLGFASLELFLRSIPDTLVVVGNGLQARVELIVTEKINHINEMVSRQKNTTRERKSAVIQISQPNDPLKRIQQSRCNVINYKEQLYDINSNFNKINIHYDKQNRLRSNSKTTVPKHEGKTSSASNTQNYAFPKRSICKPESESAFFKTTIKKNENENVPHKNISSVNCNNFATSKEYDGNTFNQHCFSDKISDNKTNITLKQTTVVENEIVFPCKAQSLKTNFQNINQIKANKETKDEFEIKNPFSENDAVENEDDIDEAIPEFAANGLVFRVDFPEHTVGFGQKIPRLRLPAELVKGAVVGVFISEIHNPFKFWFHIHKENHELDILMDRIERFYSDLPLDELVIPRNCLAPGHVCAALYNDMWHRAEVITNVRNNKVKVIFFDYGTVSEIDIKNIKYLPEMFSHTPMQAIRGSLSHIKPVSELWSKTAVTAFLSMVSEILLYAQIVDVDQKEQTVYMVLCDTNGNQTLQINKQMVDKGYAQLDSEWDERKIAKTGYRKRHPRDIFPTFEMLESGEYPSLSELENLLAQGIDYEKLTERIVLTTVNNDNEQNESGNSILSFNLLDTNPFKNDIISEIASLKMFGE